MINGITRFKRSDIQVAPITFIMNFVEDFTRRWALYRERIDIDSLSRRTKGYQDLVLKKKQKTRFIPIVSLL